MKTYEIFTTTGSVIGQGNNAVEAIENAGNPLDITCIKIADTLPSPAPVDETPTSAEEIIDKMKIEMPYELPDNLIPYIKEAMKLFRNQSAPKQ